MLILLQLSLFLSCINLIIVFWNNRIFLYSTLPKNISNKRARIDFTFRTGALTFAHKKHTRFLFVLVIPFPDIVAKVCTAQPKTQNYNYFHTFPFYSVRNVRKFLFKLSENSENSFLGFGKFGNFFFMGAEIAENSFLSPRKTRKIAFIVCRNCVNSFLGTLKTLFLALSKFFNSFFRPSINSINYYFWSFFIVFNDYSKPL